MITSLSLLSITIITPTLPLQLSAIIWPLPPQHSLHSLSPIAFRFSSSVAVVPTLRYGLQRTMIIVLFEDTGAPFTDVFLEVLVEVCLWTIPMWVNRSYITNPLQHFNLPKPLNCFLNIKPRETKHSLCSQGDIFWSIF